MFSLPLPSDGAEAAGAMVPGKQRSVIVDIDERGTGDRKWSKTA
jgi:hypothetical protein